MWDIIGHSKQKEYLKRQLELGALKSSYLLSGPEKVGKFTLIKRFATLIQCARKGCKECAVCKQLAEGTHPDTIFLRDDGESLKVEEIRETIRRTSLTFDSPYFLVCIENMERLTEEAANALLKTLEEPSPRVVFLMTTNNIYRIPATIISRVFTLELGGISDTELRQYITTQFPQLEEAMVDKILLISLGKPGLAIEICTNRQLFDDRLALYDKITFLMREARRSERLQFVEDLHALYKNDNAGLKSAIKNILLAWLYLLRQAFLATMARGQQQEVASMLSDMDQLQRTLLEIEGNVNKKLSLDYLMLTLS